jgi:hypothetical protein
MEEIESWVKASRKEPQRQGLDIVKNKHQDIDSIVKKAIDSVRDNRYNPSNGKPGQIQGLREEV